MVRRDPRLLPVFPKPPQACYKQGSNLANHLIRSKLTQPTAVATRQATGVREIGVQSCGLSGRRQGCRLCPHLGAASNHRSVIKEVKVNHSGAIIKITEDLCCTTTSCLYILSCTKPGCGQQYGGETGRALYLRYVEHEDDVSDPYTTKNVGIHFQLPGHSIAHMQMIPIEKN